MKFSYYSIFTILTLLSANAVSGQITINRSSFPYTGTTVTIEEDTSASGILVVSGGANKTWDFTKLKPGRKTKNRFVNSNWVEGYQNFPNANMAYYDELSTDTSVDFLNVSNTEVSFQGNYSVFNGETEVNKFKLKQLSFPMTTSTSFSSTDSASLPAEELGMDPDGPGPFPTIDSVKVKLKITNKASVIGYGTIKIPLGNFACLMQESLLIVDPSLYYYASNKWRLAPNSVIALLGLGDLEKDTTITHGFYTDDARVKYSLLTYEFAPGEDTAFSPEYASEFASVSGSAGIAKSNVVLFPNAATDKLSYKLAGTEKAAQADIFDLKGQLIGTHRVLNNEGSIAVSNISKGFYIINFKNNSGQVIAGGKWIKE